MSDIVERLWASDAASALTNEAAREITLLRQQLASARDAALEEAAVVIVENIIQDTSTGKTLVLRQDGNRDGLYYATAIRSLKSGQEGKR